MANLDPGEDSVLQLHRRREAVLARFDDAWEQSAPLITEFVSPEDPDRLVLLESLVRRDLEHRLRRRWAVTLELYLTRYPELVTRRDVVVRLVVAEWAARASSGNSPQEEDFASRFPDHWADATALLGFVPTASTEVTSWMQTDQFDPARRPTPPPPHRVGDRFFQPELSGYELGRELGRGAMGVVWQARQVRLDRQVAIKVLRDPREESDALERLRREARNIASLSHPNIVQIHEIGDWAGSPFLIMELCQGGSLGQRLRARPLPAPEAAQMLESLALGMQAAHEAGIIHRDLKPDNILLTQSGTAKITDFGLARRFREPGVTTPGFIVGTPAYMPPEQTGSGTRHVGPASDIYSLGAILYECLTGRPPFLAPTVIDVLYKINTEEPVALRTLNRAIPRDLETIALKCLQKDPARRYASAKELAADLHRFQTGEPTLARPTPAWERAYRWSARHPTGAALIGVASLAFFALLLSIFLWQEGRQSRLREEQATENVEASEDKRRELALLKARSDYQLGLSQAATRLGIGEPFAALNYLADAVAMDESKPYIGFEHAYLRRLSDIQRARVPCPEGQPLTVAWAPDGKAFAVAGTAGVIWLFDLDTEKVRTRYTGHRGVVRGLAFRPDGRVLGSVGDDGSVRLWDVGSGKSLRVWANAHPGGSRGIVFDPKGAWVATAGNDAKVNRWHPDADKPVQVLDAGPGPSLALAVHPGGTSLLVSSSQPPTDKRDRAPTLGLVIVIDLRTGQTLRRHLLPYPTAGVGYSSTGDEIVCPDTEDRLGVYDPQVHSIRYASRLFLSKKVQAVAVSADGNYLAAADEGAVVALGGYPQLAGVFHRLEGHAGGPIHQLAFSPDSRLLASVAEDSTIRVWRTVVMRPRRPLGGRARATGSIALSPDGKTLALAESTGYVSLYDPHRKKFLRRLCMPQSLRDMVFTHDNKALITVGLDIEMWDLATGAALMHVQGFTQHETSRVAISNDSRWLAVSGNAPSFRVFDRNTPAAEPKTYATGYSVETLGFTPDGRWLFVSSGMRVLRYDTATWKNDGELTAKNAEGNALRIGPIAISDDGKILAALPGDSSPQVWDIGGPSLGKPRVDPGRDAKNPAWFGGVVQSVVIAPKSSTLLVVRPDGRHLGFGDAQRPRIRRVLRIGQSPTGVVALDGDTFILANGYGEIRTYTNNGESQEDWDDSSAPPFDRAAFSADGMRLVTAAISPPCEFMNLYPFGISGILNYPVHGRGSDPLEYRDALTGRYLGSLARPLSFATYDAAIAPGGAFGAFAVPPRAGWTYDLENKKLLATAHTSERAAALEAAFKTAAEIGGIGGPEMRNAKFMSMARPPSAVAIDARGTRLALAEAPGAVSFWNPRTSVRLPGTIPATEGPVNRMVYSPDGQILAVLRGRAVQLGDVNKGEVMPTLSKSDLVARILGVAFSADGRAFAVCREDGASQVWDLAKGGDPINFRTTGSPPTCIAFSSDGRTLATGTVSGEIRFWSTRLARLLCTLPGRGGPVHDIAFSPDGERMATVARSSGGRSQLDVWETHPER